MCGQVPLDRLMIVARHDFALYRLRFSANSGSDMGQCRRCHDAREGALFAANRDIVPISEIADPAVLRVRCQHRQTRGIVYRQRLQENRVDEAEYGSIRADAERQRHHGRESQAGILQGLVACDWLYLAWYVNY